MFLVLPSPEPFPNCQGSVQKPPAGDWATHGVSSLWHCVTLPLTTRSVILGCQFSQGAQGWLWACAFSPQAGNLTREAASRMWDSEKQPLTRQIAWWISLGSAHLCLPTGLQGWDTSQKLIRWARAEQGQLWTGLGEEKQVGWDWRGMAQGGAIPLEKPGYGPGRDKPLALSLFRITPNSSWSSHPYLSGLRCSSDFIPTLLLPSIYLFSSRPPGWYPTFVPVAPVQFNSVAQSCLTLWPHGLQHARPPCPSPTPRACSNSYLSSHWCHLILCHPLPLLPSIIISIRTVCNESVLCIRWPKYWSFSFSLSPSNEYSGLISFRID